MSETYPVPERVRMGSPSPIHSREAYLDAVARATNDPNGYWLAEAHRRLQWYEPPTVGLEGDFTTVESAPFTWFRDGVLNVTETCVDRHLGTRGNKVAILWEGDEPGTTRSLTYRELHREVCRAANALVDLGVEKGDRVIIYMGMVPEAAIAMLACARVGAVHSVVFGGFSAESLRDRINDAQASVLVTADGGWRRGQVVPLKAMADEALTATPSITDVVIVQRLHGSPVPVHIVEGRDHWYHRLMQDASYTCAPE